MKVVLASALLLLTAARVAAQPAETAAEPPRPALEGYLQALAERRLIASETGSVERLRALVRHGEMLYLDERYDETAVVLFEVAESPRFSDFSDLEEFRGAEFMLAGALRQLGALQTAARYLERILSRGAEDPYFGPAYRRYVDVALEGGDLAGAATRLEALSIGLPEDAQNELRYLRGRERYDDNDLAQAEPLFGEITRRSRFFANAQYLRGVIAVQQRDLPTAETHFCSIATSAEQERYNFFVDGRFFEVRDLAHLGLGRVAHEGSRSDDAFYYYFQIPVDSDRVAEALFESAYAMYEGNDNDTAIDLLDQLDTRFPGSAFSDEAALLRGYVHLGRCEFEEAERLFEQFSTRFEPVVREINAIFANPARQERVVRELLDAQEVSGRERDEATTATTYEILHALLRVDPVFFRLYHNIRTLDAESARAGRLSDDLDALGARVQGGDQPRAAAAQEEFPTDAESLEVQVEDGRASVRMLTEQLDAMRRAGAPQDRLQPLEEEARAIAERVERIASQLAAAHAGGEGAPDTASNTGSGIEQLFARDVAAARAFPRRIAAVRTRLITAANQVALAELRELSERLGGGLRRSRIGRIDAVMGSKRRIERQIESLSAGRFPPELIDPLRFQGLLRDDEEYWPFEGEQWDDEREETVPSEEDE